MLRACVKQRLRAQMLKIPACRVHRCKEKFTWAPLVRNMHHPRLPSHLAAACERSQPLVHRYCVTVVVGYYCRCLDTCSQGHPCGLHQRLIDMASIRHTEDIPRPVWICAAGAALQGTWPLLIPASTCLAVCPLQTLRCQPHISDD